MKFTLKNIQYVVSFPIIRMTEDAEELQKKLDYHAINFPGEECTRPTVTCFIKDKTNNDILSVTKAECSPNDRYVRVKGEKIALLRGLIAAGFTKEEREEVWAQYFQSSGPRRNRWSNSQQVLNAVSQVL